MMTKIGFFSVVEKPPGKICIRSRRREDLNNLLDEVLSPVMMADILRTRNTDYPYRVIVDREEFMRCFDTFLKLVTYSNFKNEVAKTNRRREHLYHQVWALLRQIEEEN